MVEEGPTTAIPNLFFSCFQLFCNSYTPLKTSSQFIAITGYSLIVYYLFLVLLSLTLLTQGLCPFHQWLENHRDCQRLTTNLSRRLQIKHYPLVPDIARYSTSLHARCLGKKRACLSHRSSSCTFLAVLSSLSHLLSSCCPSYLNFYASLWKHKANLLTGTTLSILRKKNLKISPFKPQTRGWLSNPSFACAVRWSLLKEIPAFLFFVALPELDNDWSGESFQQTDSSNSGRGVREGAQLWCYLTTILDVPSYYNNTRYYYQDDSVQNCKLTAL